MLHEDGGATAQTCDLFGGAQVKAGRLKLVKCFGVYARVCVSVCSHTPLVELLMLAASCFLQSFC